MKVTCPPLYILKTLSPLLGGGRRSSSGGNSKWGRGVGRKCERKGTRRKLKLKSKEKFCKRGNNKAKGACRRSMKNVAMSNAA
jgi:hypothetical protein